MNCITLAYRVAKEIQKDLNMQLKIRGTMPNTEEYNEMHANATTRQKAILQQRMIEAVEYQGMMTRLTWPDKAIFITIRPNPDVSWDTFRAICDKYVSRKMFISGTYSFEQKGESEDTLGKGFHIHLVVKSKDNLAQVLKNTINTFKHVAAANCVKVLDTSNGQKLIQDYLIDYKSKDEHKEATQAWDALWRINEGLQPLYEFSMPSSSTDGI